MINTIIQLRVSMGERPGSFDSQTFPVLTVDGKILEISSMSNTINSCLFKDYFCVLEVVLVFHR